MVKTSPSKEGSTTRKVAHGPMYRHLIPTATSQASPCETPNHQTNARAAPSTTPKKKQCRAPRDKASQFTALSPSCLIFSRLDH
ncbi:hypothetical protein Cob_v012829 [Colletotrichum orbiculare MAFF 240422]|uniref:Uncharacterized protein n=1 Tax=Colletotrichum orbiculare (strain 104-T / ATCC 96160 / CBS 514.97 / LARS 414 / MAFF 240422) TaxID=1213857 RepID=A0A484F7N1_COLOR|nr:hypothetical protein Cob_v012829 [Colletotrichum orbiculare MAFF 240422]